MYGILKRLVVEQSFPQFWTRGIQVTCMLRIFDLILFKGILRSFGALVSKWPITRKRLAIEWKGLKFETQWH